MAVDPRRLARWAFTSFHVTTLVVAGVALGHVSGPIGDPLAGLNTLVGFALYLSLWGVTWWTNGRWLAEGGLWPVESGEWRSVLAAGTKWGSVTGVVFFAVLFAAFLFVVAPPISVFLLLAILVGSVVAAAIGALVGGGFATVDLAVVEGARRLRAGSETA